MRCHHMAERSQEERRRPAARVSRAACRRDASSFPIRVGTRAPRVTCEPGLQGARHDELRLRAGRARDPDNGITREMALAHLREMVAATDLAGERRLRGRLRGRTRPAWRKACGSPSRPACAGLVDRGLDRRSGAVRSMNLSVAVERMRARASRDRRGRWRHAARRAGRVFPRRPSRTSSRRSRDSRPIPTRVPIACTRRAFARARHRRRCRGGRAPSPSICSSAWRAELTYVRCRRARRAAGQRRRALARCAWGGFMRAAKLIAEEGRFDGFCRCAPPAPISTGCSAAG